jgi:hypothetical protein
MAAERQSPPSPPDGDHVWRVYYGLSSLIGIVCIWFGLLGLRGSVESGIVSAIYFAGAGITFALLGSGLRGGGR